MKDVRIGNDISVIWSLYSDQKPFLLDGLKISVYLKGMYGKTKIEDYTIKDNEIHWTFFGKDQKHTGKYSLTLVVNEGAEGMVTTDVCDLVRLVSCTCQADGSDEDGVQTETIAVNSEVELLSGGFGRIDTALDPMSENAVSNAVITAEFGKVNEATSGLKTQMADDKAELMTNLEQVGVLAYEAAMRSSRNEQNKVSKEEGKGLSTNDYTDEDKEKLAGLENYDDTAVKQQIGLVEKKADFALEQVADVESQLTELSAEIAPFVTEKFTPQYTIAYQDTIIKNGGFSSSKSYQVTSPILLRKGDTIVLKCYVGSEVQAISLTDANGSYYEAISVGGGNSERRYTATDNCYVALCWLDYDDEYPRELYVESGTYIPTIGESINKSVDAKVAEVYQQVSKKIGVSFILTAGEMPNVNLETRTLDLGSDPILLIGSTQYQLSQIHSDSSRYRSISLNHESGTSAIKLIFNINTKEFGTKAYYEELADYEVLIGGIRWTWDNRVIFDFPFEYTIDGDDAWDGKINELRAGASVSLIADFYGMLPNVDINKRTLDLGDDPILLIGRSQVNLKNVQPNSSKYRNILLSESTGTSAMKVVFNIDNNEFYSKSWAEELSINEVLIGGVRWSGIKRFNFPFEYTINGKPLWESEGESSEISELRKHINVSLIGGDGNVKPNINLSSRTLDLGIDPILLIGNSQYVLSQIHSDSTKYRSISLSHESGTSAIKLIFDVKTKEFGTKAYHETLENSEVLIGGIRWTWDSRKLFTMPFEYTIDGKEQWEDDVAKGGIVKQLRCKTAMKFLAHRGLHLNSIPENSLDACRYAARCGYDYVEVDFQATSDGELVLMHNGDINATMRNAADYSAIANIINVKDYTLAELRENYVLASDDPRYRKPIPTLEELLITCRDCGVFPVLEIKNFGNMDNTHIKSAFDMGCEILGEENFGFVSFSASEIDYLRSVSSKIMLGYVDTTGGIVGTLNSITNKDRCEGNTWWMPTWDIDNYGGAPLTKDAIVAHRLAGVKVAVWTTPPFKFNDLLKMGADALTTDDICPSIDGLVGKVATSDQGFSDFDTTGYESNGRLILSAGQTCRFNAGSMWLGGYYLSIIGKGNFTISAPNLNVTISNSKTDRYIYQGMVDNKVGELIITANGNTELEFVEFSCVEF